MFIITTEKVVVVRCAIPPFADLGDNASTMSGMYNES